MGSKYLNSEVNLTNQRFGRLTAIKKVNVASWLCKCDCGKEIIAPYSNLTSGLQKSCGCWREECKKEFGNSAKKHGGYGTALYKVYCRIKQRCYNPNATAYHRYGGRGIKMCDEWYYSFDAFRTWANKNGYNERSGLSIDRIDSNGPYSPENCRFATPQEQSLNRYNTVLCTYNGKEYSSWGFAKAFGITSPTFAYKRLKAGVSPEKVLEEWVKSKSLPDYLITVEEAAAKYGKTEGHIRRLLNQGKLKGERINWKWYVNKEQE